MKGTDKQKRLAQEQGVKDWSPEDHEGLPDGFTLEQYEEWKKTKELPSRACPATLGKCYECVGRACQGWGGG